MKNNEFNDAYRVDGGFFEGTPTVGKNMEKIEHEYPLGVINKLYTPERWLQINLKEIEDEHEEWLLKGKLTICAYPVGCVVVVGFKLDESPWTVTVLNPRNYLNEDGKLTRIKNTSRYKKGGMQCNYSVTHFVDDVQYYARMRKVKFENGMYLSMDKAMAAALENRYNEELVKRQTKDCLSWDNKMFLRFKRHNSAKEFEEISE